MTYKKTGGPAFPPMHDPNTHVFGMTLRDWFAGQALAGLLANGDMRNMDRATKSDETALAEAAFLVADAMLAARETDHD